MNLPRSIRARWIWTGNGPPIRDGVITIADDLIVSVEPWNAKRASSVVSRANLLDLGDCCLLPGFINSHTHLEFSDLRVPISVENSFAQWIVRVIQHRAVNAMSARGSPEERANELHNLGASEAASTGTALALNVVHGATSLNRSVAVDEILFPELMATTALRRQQTWRSARSMMRESCERNRDCAGESPLRMGLSPHAPYTTTGKLVRQAADRCRQFQMPMMMHLAETLEELEWIERGRGPLADMLDMMVGPLAESTKDRLSLSAYVNEIIRAPFAFVVHGNYLDADSIRLLATNRDHAAVVYCPRTHLHFGHEPYPLEKYLREGVRVFLGTDSRASNPDLNIWEEAKSVAKNFPKIAPEKILCMITSDPAEMLGLQSQYGYLRANAIANITSIPCIENDPNQVLQSLMMSDRVGIISQRTHSS